MSSSVCSAETMSYPDVEEAFLSDEELSIFESPSSEDMGDSRSEHDGCTRPRTRRAVILTDETLTDYDELRVRESFESFSEYDEDNEEEGFNVLSPNKVVRRLKGPQVPYKEWIKTKEASKVKAEQFLPSIYTLPHFNCERPGRSRANCPSVLNKKDVRSLSEMAAAHHSAGWLIETMDSMSINSGRTVDRLRKRLAVLVEERNKNKPETKASQGGHLTEAKIIASSYAQSPIIPPVLNRCHAVPSFEQYVVNLIKDRGAGPKLRAKRRRIHTYSKRHRMRHDFDQPDFFVDEWKSPNLGSSRKKNARPGKSNVKKSTKVQNKQFKSKASTGSKLRSETIKEVDETDDIEDHQEQLKNTENIVDIIVGITDCVAFRNRLEMINESEEDATPSSGISSDTTSPEDGSPAAPNQKVSPKNKPSATPSSPSTSGESSVLDGELSGSESKDSPQYAESVSPTKPGLLNRKTTPGSREKTGIDSSLDQTNGLCPDRAGGSASPEKIYEVCADDPKYNNGQPEALPEEAANSESHNLELFDARKINRKYSFDKLKAKRKYQKKHGFLDILKKFTRIQKIAYVFRKGAMMKRKKGIQKKTFRNPLVMSPSPDPTETFIGQVTKRRDALLPANILPPNFRHPTPEEFRTRLLGALEQFVVRKEQVISNYKSRSLTSITFTRPDLFAN